MRLSLIRLLIQPAVLGAFLGIGIAHSAPPSITGADTGPAKGTVEHIRAVTAAVDDEALINAGLQGDDWLTYGRSYAEQRHSPLTQINRDSLSDLGLAWTIDLGTKRGIQSTPLVVDGIMYLTGPWSILYAIDVRKGELLWTFDPEVDRDKAIVFCCGVVNRGPALYRGSVFVATLDGRLISVDAADGSPNWSKQTFDPRGSYYSITGAVRAFDGKVLIGNGGAEFHARGFVSAYDAATGDLVWRFYTVPGDPRLPFEHPDLEAAAKTWTGEWWKQGGGGTVWDSIVYDPELRTVYIGVGNGSHWNQKIRSPKGGDNLYLSSIVALKVETGEYLWHYQTTPGDTWDYTATQPITLAELEIDGEKRKVLMQAPKNGFFYIIDRETGELINAEPYTYTSWASRIGDDGRPVENPGARYDDGKAHWITPGSHGAHNWQPQAYNPNTGLVYIPGSIKPGHYYSTADDGYGGRDGLGVEVGVNVSLSAKLYRESVIDRHPAAPYPGQSSGRLIAFDPLTMTEVWGVDQPLHYNGGVLSTAADLVMQADATGTFTIRDASTGEALFTYDLRAGGIAPPITYSVDGEQYITVPVGWGGGQGQTAKAFDNLHPGTIYTFKLGGTAQAPAKRSAEQKPLTDFAMEASPELIGHGVDVFFNICAGCHSLPGAGGGALPDLARSSATVLENLDRIVLDGAYASQGMPRLGHVLDMEDIKALQAFIAHMADSVRQGADGAAIMAELASLQLLYDQGRGAE